MEEGGGERERERERERVGKLIDDATNFSEYYSTYLGSHPPDLAPGRWILFFSSLSPQQFALASAQTCTNN